jgi:hypothetical protein
MEYTREFEVFWKLYPTRWDRTCSKRIKRKKFPAFEKWQALEDDTRHEILTKAKFIKDFEGSSARDAVTWLNNRGWDDIEFNPDYVPILPKELTEGALKKVEPNIINVSNERNKQKNKLGIR